MLKKLPIYYKITFLIFLMGTALLLFLFIQVERNKKPPFCPTIMGFDEPVCATEEVLNYLAANPTYTTPERRENVQNTYSIKFESFRDLQFVTYMHYRGWIDGDMIFSKLEKPINRMMSIGGGIGSSSLYILKKLATKGQRPQFVMVEKYGRQKPGKYFFFENMLREFYQANGIEEHRVTFINGKDEREREAIKNHGPFELIISLRAMGYHFPIGYYLKEVIDSTDKEALLVFDVSKKPRKAKYFKPFEKELRQHYTPLQILYDYRQKIRSMWRRK